MNDCKTILLDNHRRPDLKVCFLCVLLILFLHSVLQNCQGNSAPLVDYQSRYDHVRVKDLTSGIRGFALCVGSRLINSVRVLVEEFLVVKFKIFEETVKNTKNRKNNSNICFLIYFVVDV